MKNSPTFKAMFAFLIVVITGYSCISSKKIDYLQDPPESVSTYKSGVLKDNVIKPGDELYIRVSSFDDIAHNFFSAQSSSNNMNYGNETSVALISYTVNSSGYIDFPILGQFLIKDLNIDEASEKMKVLLSEYFNQPTVLIRFVNKRITILGEVRVPGTYIFTKDHLNILEALALAGDITIHGNRNQVNLIRSQDGVTTNTMVNMTRDDLFLTENYYLRSDDIIYVKSRNSVKWGVISVPINIAFGTVTTALLIYSFFQ